MPINFKSGIFQILAVFTSVGAIVFQVAALAGSSWYYFSYSANGNKVMTSVGIFAVCQTVNSDNGWVWNRCVTQTSIYGDQLAAADNPYGRNVQGSDPLCWFDQGSTSPVREDMLPAIRGNQALAIVSVLLSVVCFAVVLLWLCDKMATTIPAFIAALVASAGNIGTFVIFWTEFNDRCSKTFCEALEQNYFNANVSGFYCAGSYGMYFVFASAVFLFGSCICLQCTGSARRNPPVAKIDETQAPLAPA
jgi:hypothetical protein